MAAPLTFEESQLDSLLQEPLKHLGFNRARQLIFQRDLADVKQLLRFPTRSDNNILLFNVNCAARFDRIEKLLGNSDPLLPTFMMPAHLLRPKKEHIEWMLTPDSHRHLIETVMDDCRQYVLPFLDSMSNLERFKSELLYAIEHYAQVAAERARFNSDAERVKFDVALQKEKPRTLVLTPEQGLEKLAAIYVLEGNKDAAEHVISSELAKLKLSKQLPPQIAERLRWERLRKVLLAPDEPVP